MLYVPVCSGMFLRTIHVPEFLDVCSGMFLRTTHVARVLVQALSARRRAKVDDREQGAYQQKSTVIRGA